MTNSKTEKVSEIKDAESLTKENKVEPKISKKELAAQKKEESKRSKFFDLIKWIFAISMVVAAIILDQVYAEVINKALSLGGVLLTFALAIGIIYTTALGNKLFTFFKDSKQEIRKVIWPTRKEALNTTFIVLIATGFLGLILWGLDSILLMIVNYVTSIGN